jgi:hypothetical protein
MLTTCFYLWKYDSRIVKLASTLHTVQRLRILRAFLPSHLISSYSHVTCSLSLAVLSPKQYYRNLLHKVYFSRQKSSKKYRISKIHTHLKRMETIKVKTITCCSVAIILNCTKMYTINKTILKLLGFSLQ